MEMDIKKAAKLYEFAIAKDDGIITICNYCESPFNKAKVELPQYINDRGRKYPVYAIGITSDRYPWWGVKHIVIPEGIMVIEPYAFENIESLTEIELPKSLKYIGNGAFSGCVNIKKLRIPESITYIGKNAFSSNTEVVFFTA